MCHVKPECDYLQSATCDCPKDPTSSTQQDSFHSPDLRNCTCHSLLYSDSAKIPPKSKTLKAQIPRLISQDKCRSTDNTTQGGEQCKIVISQMRNLLLPVKMFETSMSLVVL